MIRHEWPSWETLSEDEKTWLHDLSNEMRLMLTRGDIQGAVDHMNEAGLSIEQTLGLWTRFDSKERRAMKDIKKAGEASGEGT